MKKPALVIPDRIDVPEARCYTAGNGVVLHTLPDDDFQVVRMTLVVRAGTARQHRAFAAGATANLLSEGNAAMSGTRIAERLDYYGSYYDVSLDRDYVYLTFASLSRFFLQTLEVASEILLRPLFPEKEVVAYREKRRQLLGVERTKVDVLAREEFARRLFGPSHPYGIAYPEAEYDGLERSDLVAHYRRFYTAGNCFAVCSGHLTDEALGAVCHLLEGLPAGDAIAPPGFPAPNPVRTGFILRPEAVQSSIRIGRLLFTRAHPDFVGMQVVAAVLGGYFGSRLMRTLREERGYTYGVMAAMVNFEREGYMAIATQTGAEVTRQAIDVCMEEIERLRREPVPAEELQLVRNILTGEMMRILDGPFGIADVTIENILCGTDNRAVEEHLQRIRTITPEEVRSLAQRYLAPADLTTVVVGPADPFAAR